MSLTFCAHPGCPTLVTRGRCPAHAPRQRFARAGYAEVHAWFNTVAWQRLRWHILREQPFCRVCRAQGRNVLATDVDHIVKHAGDRQRFWDVENLQALCKRCHQAKTVRGE